MDVARIEAISPQKIDWRRLTAKEIIKYEQQGVEVPAQYLQWAQEIRNSLETTDDITYEKASYTKQVSSNNAENNITGTQEFDENSAVLTSNTEGEQAISDSSVSSEEKDQKLTAREYLENLKKDGVGVIKQGVIFRNLSNENISQSENSVNLVKADEAASNSEIEALDSYMQDLLAQIQDVKSEIQSTKSKNNGLSKMSDISRLKQQLKSLGVEGQAMLAAYGGDFNMYQADINSVQGIADNTIDYGSVTQDLGSNIKRIFYFYGLGAKIEKTGSSAISAGEDLDNTTTQALATNSENLSQVSSYKGDIASQTGVSANTDSNSENSENSDKNKSSNSKNINAKKESEKTVKTSQNDGTDETAKASTNIDEILKRKIRKGENINPA